MLHQVMLRLFYQEYLVDQQVELSSNLHLGAFAVKGGDLTAVLPAGIPNITGTIGLDSDSGSQSGAFYRSGNRSGADGWDSSNPQVTFDASRCSSIYGKSDTVQVPSIVCIAQYKF